MDILSLTGLILAIFALVGGSILKGAGVSALWNGAAFVIVIIGTLAASLLQTPMPTFKRAMAIAGWIVKPPAGGGRALIERIVGWSNISRKQGLLGLEPEIEQQTDPFIRKGLQMLVDGVEPEVIRSMMEIELETIEHTDTAAAKVFEGMGIYAPTLGIIGAVLGLMAVMKNLSDPSKLGPGIAAAFTATVYGIGAANLLFLPMANKLKDVLNKRSRERELIIEGLVAIAQGENPRNIEARLGGFLH
ncbi:MAG: flagellar motor protein [Xanthomonadaceae bacterium]|nr:flagellar motor protein [Xanthomonadaceae bacterium]